jgi:hypothetical protein
METLRAKYAGHWNYYGIIGNSKSLSRYYYETSRILFKWLNRRSQRRSLTGSAFNRLLNRFQVPPPRVVERTSGVQRLPGRPAKSLKQTRQVNLFGAQYRAARACVSRREEPGALCGQLGYVVPSPKTVDSLGFSHSPHHIIFFK